MYLSRLDLNLYQRKVRHDVGDRYDLHRRIMQAFPPNLADDERVLYRVEQPTPKHAYIIVQSQYQPDWTVLDPHTYLLDDPQTRHIRPQIREGQVYRFRLQANPTVKREGKRHAIYQEPMLEAWLERKAENHGFALQPQTWRMRKMGTVRGKTKGEHAAQKWYSVQFDGRLRVTNDGLFEDALARGIGSAKAFGFGLLSIPYHNA